MDYLKCSIKNIMRKKLRSCLTITGIAIGVLSVVIISIIGDIGKNTINIELDSMGVSGVYVRTATEVTSEKLGKKELDLVQSYANVKDATPLMTKLTNIKVRESFSNGIVWGVDSNAANIINMNLLYGRLIDKNDIVKNANVCVVDESFAKSTYKRSNIVGKKVSMLVDNSYKDFEIVGIVESGGNILQGLMGDVVPSFVFAPFTSLTNSADGKNFNQIVIQFNDKANEQQSSDQIVSALNKSLGVEDGIKVENLNQQKDNLNSVLDIVSMILAIIGGISLIVAGLSIMTVMLVTVNERTREIGIKKSIGASKKTILIEFLTESLLLSLIGSAIGATLAIALSVIGCLILKIPIIINFQVILFCILFSVGIGILFGVYPAIKASSLKPVDALRN